MLIASNPTKKKNTLESSGVFFLVGLAGFAVFAFGKYYLAFAVAQALFPENCPPDSFLNGKTFSGSFHQNSNCVVSWDAGFAVCSPLVRILTGLAWSARLSLATNSPLDCLFNAATFSGSNPT